VVVVGASEVGEVGVGGSFFPKRILGVPTWWPCHDHMLSLAGVPHHPTPAQEAMSVRPHGSARQHREVGKEALLRVPCFFPSVWLWIYEAVVVELGGGVDVGCLVYRHELTHILLQENWRTAI
jgi:hypothetical protein